MRRKLLRTAEPPRLELMPLLDVVFLLLTFFAFAMMLMVRADVLDVELPVLEAGAVSPDSTPPVVISITAEGSLALDAVTMPDDDLIATLSERQAADPEISLVLEVDSGAPSGRLIAVVQRLRLAGFDRLGILGQTPTP